MKMITYLLRTEIPGEAPVFAEKSLDWSEENEKIAQREAFEGKYTLEEAQEEPGRQSRIAQLEEALELLLSGVSE